MNSTQEKSIWYWFYWEAFSYEVKIQMQLARPSLEALPVLRKVGDGLSGTLLAQGSSWNHQPSCLVQFLRIRIESSFDFVTTEYICNTLRTLGLGLEYPRFCLWLLTYKTIYNTAKNKKFMRPLQFSTALFICSYHIHFQFN